MAQIVSVANGSIVGGLDGLYVTVVLNQPPTLPVFFYGSSVPGETGPLMVGTPDAAGSASYHVRITSTTWDPADVAGTAIPVWMTVADSLGVSRQVPVFLRKGSNFSALREVAEALQEIIRANLPLINTRIKPLSTLARVITIETVTVGGVQQVPEGQPAIDIRGMTDSEGEWELPLTRLKSPRLSISVFAYHANEMSWWNLIVEATSAVRDILSTVPYNRIGLASGLELNLCLCGDTEYFEGRTGESIWATTGQLPWSCNFGLAFPGRLGD